MTEPCMFPNLHEPFYCRIHADVRLRLTDERCRRGVTLTQPQPDAGLRDDLRGLLHEISGDLDARADSGDDISRDLGDRLRAALRSTPAAPDPVADVLLVREQDFRSTPAAPKEDDRG